MMVLEEYLAELFASRGDDPATQKTRLQAAALLQQSYQAALAAGLPPEQAASRAMASFGAREQIDNLLFLVRLQTAYEKFHRRYPLLIRWGILGIFIIPAAVAVLFQGIDQKVTALVAWVIAILVFVTYIMAVEYVDYRYQRFLRQDPFFSTRLQEEKSK